MEINGFMETLCARVAELGADRASVITTDRVPADRSFRALCEQNVCGNYGKNWGCPPDAGDIDELMARIGTFRFMLVFQTIGKLEDSFDFEGMADAAKNHAGLIGRVRAMCAAEPFTRYICLGAGGCTVCGKCAKLDGEPCRHPELRTVSLEAYGVNVSKLAPEAGMKYINGQNTVTYFGAVLFDL